MKFSIPIAAAVAALALSAGCSGQAEAEVQQKPTAQPAPAVGQPAPAAAAKAPMAFDEQPAVGTRATCPVMKGEFVVSETTDHSEYKGKHYAFCCPGCKPQFDADPEKFIGG